MTLDTFVEADILATCNTLGTEIKGVYYKGKDCIECLKDILRYLKKDSEENAVLRYLGSLRLVQTDLIPILKLDDKDKEIVDYTLRILIVLTTPAPLLYKEDLPDDKLSRNLYLQIISFLQDYKKAFTDIKVWKILYERLKNVLEVRPIERNEEEKLILERIVILIRNVLHVPPDESILKRTDDDISLHDKLLWCLHESNIAVLLLYIAANEEEYDYCMHILEIVSLMLREHTAETLATANEVRTDEEKQKDLNILSAACQREQNLKAQKIQTVSKSRFNGVYCIKNMKSLSDKDYIAHKLIVNIEDVKFDLQKNAKCKPKNRRRAPDIDNTRHSTLSTRVFLKNFSVQFLKSYNKFMLAVKRELVRKVSDEHDETYYFWAVCYFMQFNRLHDFQVAFVTETVSTQTFHHIQTEITNYHEMMLTDKKKTLFWAKRMQLGVSAYKELLETLRKMERSEDENIREGADTLVSHVFYVIEYREMLLSLLTCYDEVKFPLSYLAELVESTQLFLKMLENHSKKHSEIIVQQKKKKVNRRKKKKTVVSQVSEPVNEDVLLNEQWSAISRVLSAGVIGRRDIPNVTPFDGASDLTFEEQKVEAVYKIREEIIANEPLRALSMLRAARELWSEGDSFGATDIEPEAEFEVLREIHFSNLKKDLIESSQLEEEVWDDEEDEETESMPAVDEQRLDLKDVYKKYASPKVVQPCALLLDNYQANKPSTNMCLIKLLHRIAWNCKMHALFFQSTVFLTFQKIFHDPDAKTDPVIKEFYRFAKFITQKFFSVVQNNSKLFIEMLFWKGSREAYELEEGYGASENKIKGWTDDDDEELRYLYEENKDIYMEGQDVADIILANFNKGNRTKTQIISALKRLGLIKSAKELKPEKRSEWIESEVLDLRHLFEDYNDADDVMSNIIERLTIKRSRKAVVDKLLELNLIQDRKEVRKKSSKRKKSRVGDSDNEESDPADFERRHNSESSDNDENEINFFKNLEAERLADANSLQNHDENYKDSIHIGDSRHGIKNTDKDKKNKVTEVWEEQEIMELTTLFNENSHSGDIMHILLNSLTVKRPKKAIVEKLLELGLIKDSKYLKEKEQVTLKRSRNFDGSNISLDSDKNDDNNTSNIDLSANNVSSSVFSEMKRAKRRILSDSSDEDSQPTNTPDINISQENSNNNQASGVIKQKRPPKVWEEQEIFELTSLFNKHNRSNDVMEALVQELSVKRPKQAVIEKLLELGIIKDKKEVRKKRKLKSKKDNKASQSTSNVNGESSDEDMQFGQSSSLKENDSLSTTKIRPAKVWEEQEIIELSTLFHENSESDDIMSAILKSLSVKRTKQAVVGKLLELGLIKDKKEIRKKRETKPKAGKLNKLQSSQIDKSDNENNRSDIEFIKIKSPEILQSKKRLRHHVLSDSSDDDEPLKIDVENTINYIESSLNYRKNLNDFDAIKSNDSAEGLKRAKRKRILVSSEESGDETAGISKISNNNSDNSRLNFNVQEDSPNLDVTKMKRKFRVLDDSDDSN